MNLKELIINLFKPINIPMTKLILNNHYKGDKALSGTNHAKRVLILAPHMDDETIGPGGTIKRHADEGAEVHCVFITDGSNSVSDLPKEELIKARQREVENVKDILGLTDIHYMGLPDGEVASDEASQQQLLAIIKKVNPDMIYSTLLVDAHPDHTATARILADTIEQIPDLDCTIRQYEINCAIPPAYINCNVDISQTFDTKKAAIDKFESQAIAFDGFLALNKIKANIVNGQVRAVEGFLELSPDELVAHAKKIPTKDFSRMFKQINRTDTLLWAIFKNLKAKQDMYRNSL
ncbi:PIG-L deacetylase family protein [Aquibacillus albus]|uniref:LmbE family N-acetylglucosaminyl deacetylase n=1 Tax=Aquibacillus albus TaxID=1168171 RepID=A0ABS2MZM7_9BACI|nr:PIG-L deacetylase family protein [Aquibacillus albus]MBM7571337.1 LmbE family N-acetylglucosaminyl deacetylase [Aquibacillus albus]